MFDKVKNKFEEYISNFDMKVMEISLKYHHSYAVSDLMAELAFRLDLSKEEIELAKVIGLLHDIGRFEEIKTYGTFNSEFDHALDGSKYLFDLGHIREFIEDSKFDSIIDKAIRYHNKKELPDGLSDKELLFCKMIRDMDKVDIYKQVATHYEYTFNASEINEKCLRDFQMGILVDRKDTKSTSDRVLMKLSFIYDINFDESFDILVETDNFDLFLGTIDVDSDSERLFRKVKEVCFDKINRGLKEED